MFEECGGPTHRQVVGEVAVALVAGAAGGGGLAEEFVEGEETAVVTHYEVAALLVGVGEAAVAEGRRGEGAGGRGRGLVGGAGGWCPYCVCGC